MGRERLPAEYGLFHGRRGVIIFQSATARRRAEAQGLYIGAPHIVLEHLLPEGGKAVHSCPQLRNDGDFFFRFL